MRRRGDDSWARCPEYETDVDDVWEGRADKMILAHRSE
jgi:hypothetical protein